MIHTDGTPTIANCGPIPGIDDVRLNLTPFDFSIQNAGSLVVLHPCNDAARSWIDDHVYTDEQSPQWWGGGIVIEPRYLQDVLDGIEQDDLTVA